MQINNMLPALLSILNSRAAQNRVDKAPPGHDAGDLDKQRAEKAGEAALSKEAGKVGGSESKGSDLSPRSGHVLPDILPLPYKTPLFPESRFFIKNDRESQAAPNGADGPASVFVRLKTDNLGVIWIHLASKNQALSISFYTQEDSYTGMIREGLPDLVEGLRLLGYPDVRAAGITRPGITGCSDIVPGLSGSPNYLLDLEV